MNNPLGVSPSKGKEKKPITEKAKEELLKKNSYCVSSLRLHI